MRELRKAGHIPLVKPYLLATQQLNIKEVNDALYELYVQEEDHEALAAAVVEFTNFDSIEMAQQCEKHGLLQFRRIGAMLYKRSKKWALKCAKADKSETMASCIMWAGPAKIISPTAPLPLGAWMATTATPTFARRVPVLGIGFGAVLIVPALITRMRK